MIMHKIQHRYVFLLGSKLQCDKLPTGAGVKDFAPVFLGSTATERTRHQRSSLEAEEAQELQCSGTPAARWIQRSPAALKL